MSEDRDPYKVMGVSPGASDAEIREAYRDHARRLHPDIVGERGLDDMRDLNQAWAILKDAEKRAAYDAAHGHARSPRPASSDGGTTPEGDGAAAPSARSPIFAGQPAWTGAAGPPPGRPWGPVLDFGIYAGWSIGEVVRRDRGYLAWLRDKPEAKRIRPHIDRALESEPGPTQSGRSGGQASKRR